MPQVEPVRQHTNKRPMIVGVVSVVVAVVLVVIIIVTVKQLTAPKPETNKVLDDARDKAFSGKKDEAAALLKQQVAVAKSKEEKTLLYMQLGATYEGKGDAKEALSAYLEAGKLTEGFGINQAIARAAENSGDKALALEYQQKNLKLIRDGKVPYRGEGDRKITEEAIVRLGGKL
jgi:hypothetical protein